MNLFRSICLWWVGDGISTAAKTILAFHPKTTQERVGCDGYSDDHISILESYSSITILADVPGDGMVEVFRLNDAFGFVAAFGFDEEQIGVNRSKVNKFRRGCWEKHLEIVYREALAAKHEDQRRLREKARERRFQDFAPVDDCVRDKTVD